MEKLEICPICGHQDFKHFRTCTDYTVSKKQFEIVFCTKCNLKFTNPRPSKDEIGSFYDSPDYISHTNSKKGLFNTVYQTIRNISLKNKISWIQALKPSGNKLLDIGCGTGEFLNYAKKNNFDVLGVEPSNKARETAIKNYTIDIQDESFLAEIPDESFDLITMWHVLEHVHDLKQRVEQIKSVLKPGGFSFIAVPNYTSKDAHIYGSKWAAYDVPRHLYHFSPEVIKMLFKNIGMEHVKSIPMKFDSFYVSLLSSKYKSSSFPSIDGLLSGIRSNLHAGKDPELYSSVVYVFKKPI